MGYIIKQEASHGRIKVYFVENHHVPKKGPRQVRIYLGTLDAQSKELILSKKQSEPSSAMIELFAIKGIVYNGKKSTECGRKQVRPLAKIRQKQLSKYIDKSIVLETGRRDAMDYLATESGLTKCLAIAFNKTIDDDFSKQILSIAMYQTSEAMPLYLADEWASDTGIECPMSSSSLSRIIEDIGENIEGVNEFFRNWIKICGKPKSIVHDTTSISSYSNSIEDVEWGYNRDKEQLPQINIALVAAKESRLPLLFRIIPGSIPDVSSLKVTCKILKDLGLKDFSLSLDRGYFSSSNIIELHKSEIDFTIGVPTTQSQATKIILANQSFLESSNSSFLFNKQRIRSVSSIYNLVDNGKKIEISAHIFLDFEKKERSLGHLEKSVLEIEEKSKKYKYASKIDAENWISENAVNLTKYFNIKKISNKWNILRDTDCINNKALLFGSILILSSKKHLIPQEVLENYRCRDIAEKIFSIVKNGIGMHRLRTSSTAQVNGRLFISFISVIFRVLLEDKLKKSNLLSKYSVDESLVILKKIKKLKLSDGSWISLEIPKKARIIRDTIQTTNTK